jgi:hypothetical protein
MPNQYQYSTDHPITVALGPHRYAYGWQGNGVKPIRIDLTTGTEVYDVGIEPPGGLNKTAPFSVTRGDPARFYVTRVDVVKGGTQYSFPPKLVVTGDKEKEFEYNTYLTGSSLGGIKILNGGRGYTVPPTAEVEDSYGQGVELEVILGNGETDVDSDDGSIQTYSVQQANVSAPALPCIRSDGKVQSAGSAYVDPESWVSPSDTMGNVWTFVRKAGALLTYRYSLTKSWDKSGLQGDDGWQPVGSTEIQIEFTFTSVTESAGQYSRHYPLNLQAVAVSNKGIGWQNDDNKPVVVVLGSYPLGAYSIPDSSQLNASGTKALVVEFYTGSNPNSPANNFQGSAQYPIANVLVKQPGVGYVGQPLIELTTNQGVGGVVQANIATDQTFRAEDDKTVGKGKVQETRVINGGLYTEPPTATILSGGAEVNIISRPHLRGLYQCYTRFVDDTPEDRGGPIPSSLSPVIEFNANDSTTPDGQVGCGSITWTAPDDPVRADGRPLKVELWRSSANQATTLYRVATVDCGATYTDDLTDEELASPERAEMLAMPILLTNGELNANRFEVPMTDKAVACMFQDRVWVAADTSLKEPSTLYYSEIDEPESMPEINQLVLQNNDKSQDHITALAPFGSHLAVLMSHEYHRLSYVSQPIIDANIQVAAYRGCVNQRCWDQMNGNLYALDTEGVWQADSGGTVDPISTSITSIFTKKIDWSKSTWFSVQSDHSNDTIKISVRYKGDGEGTWPTRQLVYSTLSKSWQEFRHPLPLVGTAAIRDVTGEMITVYGSNATSLFRTDGSGTDMCYYGITSVTIEDPGEGYIYPPKISVPGGDGAILEASLDLRGRVHKVFIRSTGYHYEPSTYAVVEESPLGPNNTAKLQCNVGLGRIPIPCSAKTGNMEYKILDDPARDVNFLYEPTKAPTDIALAMYYNNNPTARNNVVERERGDGVVYTESTPLAVVNTYEKNLPPQLQNGVATARMQGVTDPAIKGNDRHVAVELRTERKENAKPIIHNIDVMGVVE